MRDEILKILLDDMDNFISGEAISKKLNVTRAAIWKHIKALQEEGFIIESISRKGYRLVKLPNKLEEITLLHGMRTRRMGRVLEIHQSIDSTNIRCRELAISDYPEGTLVIAEEQLKGRGRMGRTWLSPPEKGIWMSLLLRPKMHPKDAPVLTTIAALAVKRAIVEITGLMVKIKWPNDIIIQNKKVCGILTEIHADLDIIHYVIIGIGINVNMEEAELPEDIAHTATSILIEMGNKVDRRLLIQKIMKEIEDIYDAYIENHDLNPILDECRSCSATIGSRVKVVGIDREFEGKAIDLADDGALLVLKDNGKIEKVFSGDVSVRGLEGYV